MFIFYIVYLTYKVVTKTNIFLLMVWYNHCSVLCEDEKQAVAVKSQLQQLARPMYSNPPVHGALIVSIILGDPELKNLWLKEVKVIYHDCTFWFFFYILICVEFFSVLDLLNIDVTKSIEGFNIN